VKGSASALNGGHFTVIQRCISGVSIQDGAKLAGRESIFYETGALMSGLAWVSVYHSATVYGGRCTLRPRRFSREIEKSRQFPGLVQVSRYHSRLSNSREAQIPRNENLWGIPACGSSEASKKQFKEDGRIRSLLGAA